MPYSMALRLRLRICSADDFFNKSLNALTTNLILIRFKSGLVDNTGPGCGVRCGVRGAGATGSVDKTGSRGLLGN